MDRIHLRGAASIAAAVVLATGALIDNPRAALSESTQFQQGSSGGDIKPDFWPVVLLPDQGYPPPYRISSVHQSPYVGVKELHFFSIKTQNALGVVATFDQGLVSRTNPQAHMNFRELVLPIEPFSLQTAKKAQGKLDPELRQEMINRMLAGVMSRSVFDVSSDPYLVDVFTDTVPYITHILQVEEGAVFDRFGTRSYEVLLRVRIQQNRNPAVNP